LPRHAAEHAFQWPPEERAAGVKVFRVLDGGQLEDVEAVSEPVPVPATPVAEPDRVPKPSTSRPPLLAPEHVGPPIPRAKTRKPFASNWLRAHHSELTPALIALIAILEGVYILQVVSLRRGVQYPAAGEKAGSTAVEKLEASDKASPRRLTLPTEAPSTKVSNGRPSGTSRLDPTHGASNPLPRSKSTAGPGWIAIKSALVLDVLDGDVLVGTTHSPQLRLPAGSHTLRLKNDMAGFELTQQIRVGSGQVTQLRIDLPEGLLHINALPWAEVLVDGRHIGETPLGNLSLPIGPHEVIFRHPTLGERTLSTVVKAGVLTRVTTDMRDQPVR